MIKLAPRIFVTALIAIISAGCATQTTWVNTNNANADEYKDLYECTNQVNAGGVFNESTDYVAAPVINVGPRENPMCYGSDASMVDCFSGTPESLIPVTPGSQFKEDSYHIGIDRCMQSKGWRKEPKK